MTQTSNIGLKKIDGSENWRQIFDYHNDSMDKADSSVAAVQDGLAIVANGNTHAAVAEGQFVYVRNHSTLAEGLYKASSAIGTNATLSTSNLTADGSGGLNDLQEQVTSLNSKFAFQSVQIQTGLVAFVTENFVELNFNVTTAQGITVQGGSYAYVGYVPSNLRPYGNHAPNGIATNDGASIGIVGLQSSDGRIFIRSKETATFTSFSLVYMYGN